MFLLSFRNSGREVEGTVDFHTDGGEEVEEVGDLELIRGAVT